MVKYSKSSIHHGFKGFYFKIEKYIFAISSLFLIYFSSQNNHLTSSISKIILKISNPISNTLSFPLEIGRSITQEINQVLQLKSKYNILEQKNISLKSQLIEKEEINFSKIRNE